MDKVILAPDKRYSEINYTARLSDDRESTIINANVTYFVDILGVQERFNVSFKKDPQDEKYSVPYWTSTINSCRFGKGVQPTIVQRIFIAAFSQASDFKINCPFSKNKVITVSNLTLSDTFLPPMKIEKQFKVNSKGYAIIKEKKGWTFTNENTWYGRYKK